MYDTSIVASVSSTTTNRSSNLTPSTALSSSSSWNDKTILRASIDKATRGNDLSGSGGSGRGNDGNSSTTILATSSSAPLNPNEACSRLSPSGRAWMSDRKGPFSHLGVRELVLSAARVSILQASTTLSGFVTDQLEQEMERDELLMEGKISEDELLKQNADWEEEEWNSRWKAYPRKVLIGVSRFHAMTIVMRFHETVICESVLKLTPPTIDKLTKDPFRSALRKKERYEEYIRIGPRRFVQHKSTENNYRTTEREVPSRPELGGQMFYTCFWSNLIAFLADHTVQQCLLGYGYYVYYRQKQKMLKIKRKNKLLKKLNDVTPTNDSEDKDRTGTPATNDTSTTSVSSLSSSDPEFGEGEKGGILLSFLFRSARITASRAFGLCAASIGGALGSILMPGWGTTLGISMGDALVSVAIDE